MIFCNHCKVYIRDGKETCPLCGNILSDNNNGVKGEEIYPEIPLTYNRHMVIRILVFISVVAMVVSCTVYKMVPVNVNWPGLVFLGLVSVWLSLINVLRKRHNITKSIMWQVTLYRGSLFFGIGE